jgi:hypothetical protein
MARGQNETSWLKHQTLCEIQSTEVFLSGFNALCTFSYLLHEVKLKKKRSENEERYYRDVNTRHNETMEDKQMKSLHQKLKANEQHLHKK